MGYMTFRSECVKSVRIWSFSSPLSEMKDGSYVYSSRRDFYCLLWHSYHSQKNSSFSVQTGLFILPIYVNFLSILSKKLQLLGSDVCSRVYKRNNKTVLILIQDLIFQSKTVWGRRKTFFEGRRDRSPISQSISLK